jgi:hypothetical protein
VGADGTVEFRGREGVRGRSVFNVTLDLGTAFFCATGSERRPLQTAALSHFRKVDARIPPGGSAPP